MRCVDVPSLVEVRLAAGSFGRGLQRSDNDGMSARERFAVPDSDAPFPSLSALPDKNALIAARAGLRQPKTLRRNSSSRSAGSTLHVRFQDSPNWVTPSGVFKKRRLIEQRGMPDVKGRRFITLTLDPDQFGNCPITGYEEGKKQLRRFLEAGRLHGLWERSAYWCWKLEFQKNGWAHWHLIIDRTKKFKSDEISKVSSLWSLGRVNVRRISSSKFGYQFKYAFKGVFQDDSQDSGLCVPQWFLDHFKPSLDGQKGESYARVRFWQTSKGFYTGKPLSQSNSKESQTSFIVRTVREILEERASSILLIARDRLGHYLKSSKVRLAVDFQGFAKFHSWDSDNRAATTLSMRSFMCSPETIKNKLIEKHELWKLKQIQELNKMSLHLALKFRARRLSLETC